MSAFDDEFGLFGDEDKTPDEERTSTLGARRIASDEAAHDDIEPEDEREVRIAVDVPRLLDIDRVNPAEGIGLLP